MASASAMCQTNVAFDDVLMERLTTDDSQTKHTDHDDEHDEGRRQTTVQQQVGDATNQSAKASQSAGEVRPLGGNLLQPSTSHLVRFPALAATYFATTHNLIKHFIHANERKQQMDTTVSAAQTRLKMMTTATMNNEPKNIRKKVLNECDALCSVIDHTLLEYNNEARTNMLCLWRLSIYCDAYSKLVDDKTHSELLADGSLVPDSEDEDDENNENEVWIEDEIEHENELGAYEDEEDDCFF